MLSKMLNYLQYTFQHHSNNILYMFLHQSICTKSVFDLYSQKYEKYLHMIKTNFP